MTILLAIILAVCLFAYRSEAGPSAVGTYVMTVDTTGATSNADGSAKDVPGLTYPVSSGRTYVVEMWLPWQVQSGGGLYRYEFSGPTMTDYRLGALNYKNDGTLVSSQVMTAISDRIANTSTNSDGYVIVKGTFTPSAAGTYKATFYTDTNPLGDYMNTKRGAIMKIVPIL